MMGEARAPTSRPEQVSAPSSINKTRGHINGKALFVMAALAGVAAFGAVGKGKEAKAETKEAAVCRISPDFGLPFVAKDNVDGDGDDDDETKTEPMPKVIGGLSKVWNGLLFQRISHLGQGILYYIYDLNTMEKLAELPELTGGIAHITDNGIVCIGQNEGMEFFKLIPPNNGSQQYSLEYRGSTDSAAATGSTGGWIIRQEALFPENGAIQDILKLYRESNIENNTGGLELAADQQIPINENPYDYVSGFAIDSHNSKVLYAISTSDGKTGYKEIPFSIDQNGDIQIDQENINFIELEYDLKQIVADKTSGARAFLNQINPANPQNPASILLRIESTNETYEIPASALPSGIDSILALENGRFYVVFSDNDLVPHILEPTTEPADYIAPGIPYELYESIFPAPAGWESITCDAGTYESDEQDLCADVQCPPAPPCKTNTCDPTDGQCKEDQVQDGMPCTDGDACTEGDECQTGACQPGEQKQCDDGEDCTDDSCNQATGNCDYLPNQNPCDDNDACTEGDECATGTCQPGAPANCADDNACTADSCDSQAGCKNETAPMDGQSCALAEPNLCEENPTCQDGTCAGEAPDCNDNNECTEDSCAPEVGCINDHTQKEGQFCDDGDPETIDDTCQLGDCVGVPIIDPDPEPDPEPEPDTYEVEETDTFETYDWIDAQDTQDAQDTSDAEEDWADAYLDWQDDSNDTNDSIDAKDTQDISDTKDAEADWADAYLDWQDDSNDSKQDTEQTSQEVEEETTNETTETTEPNPEEEDDTTPNPEQEDDLLAYEPDAEIKNSGGCGSCTTGETNGGDAIPGVILLGTAAGVGLALRRKEEEPNTNKPKVNHP